MVIGAHQHQVVQFGGATVFPVHQMMGVQSAGGPATGDHAAVIAVLQRTAQPTADLAGGAGGAEGLAVALEPGFDGGLAEQVLAFFVGEQRTQMQRGHRGVGVEVEVHDDGGVLAVRATCRLSVPAGFDETHERIDIIGKRWRLPVFNLSAGVVVVFPVGGQPVVMRAQAGVELGRFQAG